MFFPAGDFDSRQPSASQTRQFVHTAALSLLVVRIATFFHKTVFRSAICQSPFATCKNQLWWGLMPLPTLRLAFPIWLLQQVWDI